MGAVSVDLPQLIDRKSVSTTLRFTNELHTLRSELPTVHYRFTSGGKVHLEGTTPTDSVIELAPRLASLPSGRYELDYTVKYRDSLSYVGQMALYLFDAQIARSATCVRPCSSPQETGSMAQGRSPSSTMRRASLMPTSTIVYIVSVALLPQASFVRRLVRCVRSR